MILLNKSQVKLNDRKIKGSPYNIVESDKTLCIIFYVVPMIEIIQASNCQILDFTDNLIVAEVQPENRYERDVQLNVQ